MCVLCFCVLNSRFKYRPDSVSLVHVVFRFYIGCDRCEDWFHGSCVGLTKSEADRMDSYVCPACRQKSSSSNKKSAATDDFPLQRHHLNELQRVVASLQVREIMDMFYSMKYFMLSFLFKMSEYSSCKN